MNAARRAKVELLIALSAVSIVVLVASMDTRLTFMVLLDIMVAVVIGGGILVVLYLGLYAAKRAIRASLYGRDVRTDTRTDERDGDAYHEHRTGDGYLSLTRKGYEDQRSLDDSFVTYPDWILRLESFLHERLPDGTTLKPMLQDFQDAGHPDTWESPQWETAARILLAHGVARSRLHKHVFYPRHPVNELIAGDYNGKEHYSTRLKALADRYGDQQD